LVDGWWLVNSRHDKFITTTNEKKFFPFPLPLSPIFKLVGWVERSGTQRDNFGFILGSTWFQRHITQVGKPAHVSGFPNYKYRKNIEIFFSHQSYTRVLRKARNTTKAA
jgi:hypothetical protein